MVEYTHEYYDLLYELEAMHSQFGEAEESEVDISYIRDRLLDIVDELYCKTWDDFIIPEDYDGEDDE